MDRTPPLAGLYDPTYEHDACGVAFVARIDGRPSHDVLERGIKALENLEHRGAQGADAHTGDGAGLLMQMPDRFFRETVRAELPEPGRYGVGVCFLPRDDADRRAELERILTEAVERKGQRVIGWRDTPVDERHCGTTAGKVAPYIKQLFIAAADDVPDVDAFERVLYMIRRCAELAAGEDLAIASMSARTIAYKGMLTALQLPGYYPDLRDERAETAVALVHSRFSTNTFPSWELAQPFRMIAHNGEINALRGNVNWMHARESTLASEALGDRLADVLPVMRPGASDSATFDNVLELMTLAGRDLPHTLMTMMPEAHEGRDDLTDDLHGFYQYHSCLMEPWDGPAAIAFTDGRVVGATLDRNGLRPGRWVITHDGWVVFASEVGVMDVPDEQVARKGRLRPGKVFFVDLEAGEVLPDGEIGERVATRRPYGRWFAEQSIPFGELAPRAPVTPPAEPLHWRQLAFGYTQEDLRILLRPMAVTSAEPTGSMGNDAALAVFSGREPPLFSYFKQLFAQVTNPPIDPIRESVVMSLTSLLGAQHNLLAETPEHARQIVLDRPILRDDELARIRGIEVDGFASHTIDLTWPVAEGAEGMERALERCCREAAERVEAGVNLVILSDRELGSERAAIPSLLATAAIHHHLVREGTRLRCGLVVESGEPRDVHAMATLLGYGANAVNPYLMLESVVDLVHDGQLPDDVMPEDAQRRVIKALGKGLLKILSKMGISTIQSYTGAQIFEAVGLAPELVERHFTGTASRIGGIGLDVLAREALERHARGYPQPDGDLLPVGGVYQWRRGGEYHAWNPDTIATLQHAVRNGGGQQSYDEFSREVNETAARHSAIRGLMRLKLADEPLPLDEVEPVTEIVKRFSTGGMSLGALSPEAHETLAVAMNRLGGRSNTGEGGEDPERFRDERRSAIKQVASGRFGVTTHYLVNADALQIKIAQGAKPGEGGQLPGHKVDAYIAALRHSTRGVGLISPPPHHDIYSIEDLKQLIYDLRCANPRARISVKLVSEIGVGTVAAGVAKANADHVTISGHDGGTGASPQSSIQSAGVPWEIGLSETQQTLLANDLRSRIIVEVDGQMRTGRDVVIGALLGADEFGFSTAPLIAAGCIMMRVCHLNTCPVGVATQDPELRARFQGTPDHVITYLMMVAEETRGLMARMGVRTVGELIGRIELLDAGPAIDHWKQRGVDLSRILSRADLPGEDVPRRRVRSQEPVLDDAIDWELIEASRNAIMRREPLTLERDIINRNRCVGGLLSSEIADHHGAEGLPEGTIDVTFTGSAGQSFGGWLAGGVTFTLIGDANDYTGKGLSGGVLTVRPPHGARYPAEENVVVGNTVLYGATSGRAFFRGLAGERFAVRNSGVSAVVEGVGDHGCEYMTGGRVVVLGATGLNFAAGMSGGVAYVLDEDGAFPGRCNRELVGLDALDDDDARELRALITEHRDRTGSTVAQRVLDQWSMLRERFVKVMPHDYRRAQAAEARNGGAGGAPVVASLAPAAGSDNGALAARRGAVGGRLGGRDG